jgi:hypothetical protein
MLLVVLRSHHGKLHPPSAQARTKHMLQTYRQAANAQNVCSGAGAELTAAPRDATPPSLRSAGLGPATLREALARALARPRAWESRSATHLGTNAKRTEREPKTLRSLKTQRARTLRGTRVRALVLVSGNLICVAENRSGLMGESSRLAVRLAVRAMPHPITLVFADPSRCHTPFNSSHAIGRGSEESSCIECIKKSRRVPTTQILVKFDLIVGTAAIACQSYRLVLTAAKDDPVATFS